MRKDHPFRAQLVTVREQRRVRQVLRASDVPAAAAQSLAKTRELAAKRRRPAARP